MGPKCGSRRLRRPKLWQNPWSEPPAAAHRMKPFAGPPCSSCRCMATQRTLQDRERRRIYFLVAVFSWMVPFPFTGSHLKRPIRKMTALSYSATTLKHMNNENGIVRTRIRPDSSVASISTHPDKFPSAGIQEKACTPLIDFQLAFWILIVR